VLRRRRRRERLVFDGRKGVGRRDVHRHDQVGDRGRRTAKGCQVGGHGRPVTGQTQVAQDQDDRVGGIVRPGTSTGSQAAATAVSVPVDQQRLRGPGRSVVRRRRERSRRRIVRRHLLRADRPEIDRRRRPSVATTAAGARQTDSRLKAALLYRHNRALQIDVAAFNYISYRSISPALFSEFLYERFTYDNITFHQSHIVSMYIFFFNPTLAQSPQSIRRGRPPAYEVHATKNALYIVQTYYY